MRKLLRVVDVLQDSIIGSTVQTDFLGKRLSPAHTTAREWCAQEQLGSSKNETHYREIVDMSKTFMGHNLKRVGLHPVYHCFTALLHL